jgi:hypothetical protein
MRIQAFLTAAAINLKRLAASFLLLIARISVRFMNLSPARVPVSG